jgi:hypothetical protein
VTALPARRGAARELGLNPSKLGKIDNHRQETWKASLPEFIESLYEKRFGQRRPEKVQSVEDHARAQARKEQARCEARAQRRRARPMEHEAAAGDGSSGLRGISTRADISPTRFWNEYQWGDLKTDPTSRVDHRR